MGLEYFAVNKRNGTFFELGRGGWYALNHDREAFSDVEYLANEILTECFHRDAANVEAWVKNEVAPALHEFASGAGPDDITIINDASDERSLMRALRYRCVGTIYGTTPEERTQMIDDQNEHLVDNPTNRRFHNPKQWVDHPGFEDYNRGRVTF